MEFKKPNRYNREQPQRNASRPSDSTLVSPRPIGRTVPNGNPPLAHTTAKPQPLEATIKPTGINLRSLPSKAAVISYIRGFISTKRGIVSVAVVLIIIFATTWLFIYRDNAAKNTGNSGNPNEIVQDLEYQTILPDGKSIGDLGGWRRVSPLESDPVFAYTDTIGTVSVNVSQQPLPKSFIGDTDSQVAELAKRFNATTKIDAGGIKVYVGSSSKGPQSAIFTKNSLLILIKSQKKIDDSAWIKYIKSLN